MKVLHVIPAVAPRYGGPSSAIGGLVRSLRRCGVDAIVATTSADGGGELDVPLGSEVEYGGMRAIFFRRDFSESYKYSRSLASWLDSNVASYDLVHIHAVFSHSSIAAAAACRKRGVPYVVRPIGSLYPWALAHHKRRKQAMMVVGGARRMLQHASALHYTCEDEKRLAEDRLRLPRGFVTSLGVDDAMFDSERIERPYVIFTGRMHVVKRLEWLIRAFASTRRDRWRLVLAGDGPFDYVSVLKSLVRDCGAAGAVDFVGWKSVDEKRALIAGAAVAALVSSQENFGVAAAEAMAAGVPVIVAREVGLSNDVAVSNAGWVVNGGGLEATLTAAMTDIEDRKRRGAAARSWAEAHYRWDGVARSLIGEYERLVGAP